MKRKVSKTRMQAVTVALNASGLDSVEVNLDKSYDECVALQFVEVDPSDVTDYNIGVSVNGNTLIDPINAKALQSDRSSAINERRFPVNIGTTNTVQLTTDLKTAPTATLKHQVILHLVKYEPCNEG
ncbi:hypothetical protein [Phaeocystidibacter marisrubri]|uniref:Uncharacterized protein n=1 Tax=Phaeocystidibacter marisrubri TaxID=1577780 RepID=A0A6L3ZC88_9FLAO|nr:hypothetical protein [Phaeocystidibacter marisrubri]KAB2815032.1 hypothetical protein F8C82_14565 [Phaeocystidibacter marisrubri]GGH78098.1 hypothetical protein GCM10011318_28810 [Phaeocystidibacter marisrubri]